MAGRQGRVFVCKQETARGTDTPSLLNNLTAFCRGFGACKKTSSSGQKTGFSPKAEIRGGARLATFEVMQGEGNNQRCACEQESRPSKWKEESEYRVRVTRSVSRHKKKLKKRMQPMAPLATDCLDSSNQPDGMF